MNKLWIMAMLILTVEVANAQSKKEQIENLTISLDSLNQVVTNERQNFNITLDSLNQVLGKNQQYFEIEIASYSIEINNLNTQIDSLISINDSINLQLKIKNQKIDSLILQKLELLADIDSLSAPKIDRENNWTLIESNLNWTEKDNSQAVKWFNKNVFNGNQDIYTPTCYSYLMDATDYYWGYPGSIEEDIFKSKWKSIFDLKYSSFGHAFQNGNCGWASFEIRNIEFLGDLNGGDWFKLTIKGGCGENDYSNTLVRLVKLTDENGSFKIANFMSLQDE
tara:strand:- start:798 stop:1637 length:840 start_codon:yes stop_codon:yes gene_type:complete